MNDEKYIGLDAHQATISVAVMDSSGKIRMESILETKAPIILEFFSSDTTTDTGFRSESGFHSFTPMLVW